MSSKLFFSNIPYNCSDREFKEWIESYGFRVQSIRLVRDLEYGVSPAFGYADLADEATMRKAIETLDGNRIRSHRIQVRHTQAA